MFRTTFPIVPPAWTSPRRDIAHPDAGLCVGSCFAERVGERLLGAGFGAAINPFGVLYHPLAIARCLEAVLAGEVLDGAALRKHPSGEVWYSPDHHSRFSDTHPARALERINGAIHDAHTHLHATLPDGSNNPYLLLTLGTAKVYFDATTGAAVANCHKLPAQAFTSRRLDVAECAAALQPILTRYLEAFPTLRIVLTVSPVRYLREGMTESSRSKAALLLATEQLCTALPRCYYFPAYELILDDLRDYRFYSSDMLHPSEVAVAYVWEQFAKTFFTPATSARANGFERLAAMRAHRPFHPDTAEYAAHVARAEALARELDSGVARK